ncbi:hypothetical protein BN903_94 [Halorubrum sp. AJ67]|nr:hypothetical protein BN903_94 [Halorubrum sp. AJ67]
MEPATGQVGKNGRYRGVGARYEPASVVRRTMRVSARCGSRRERRGYSTSTGCLSPAKRKYASATSDSTRTSLAFLLMSPTSGGGR